MSNSVVRVRENPVQDSLILVIGENGVITPDKETVQEYLKSRSETELRIMKVNKSDGQMVDVTIDHMTYIATQKEEIMYKKSKEELEQIAKCLINFRLDHDYTPFIHSPHPSDLPEIDELDQTLSLLEANPVIESMPPELVPIKIDPSHTQQLPPKTSLPNIAKRIVNPSQIIPPPASQVEPIIEKSTPLLPVVEIPKVDDAPSQPVEPPKIIDAPKPVPAKTITVRKPPKRGRQKAAPSKKESPQDQEAEPEEFGEEQEHYSDDDFTAELEDTLDDSNDSDYAIIDETPKTKSRPRRKSRSKPQSESKKVNKNRNAVLKEKVKDTNVVQVEAPKPPTPPPADEVALDKLPDKKAPPKKEKKPRKPLPNDFMLFSTPDIIRRVGGKQDGAAPTTPNTPSADVEMPESISASDVGTPQRLNTDTKGKRHSIENSRKTSTETKSRHRKLSIDQQKSVEAKSPNISRRRSSERRRTTSKVLENSDVSSTTGEEGPSAKDIRSIIQNDNVRSFTSNLVIPDSANNPNVSKSEDDEDLNLTIDSIDEILYKVAETLADDKEFQSALDKSLDENLVLNTSISSEALSSSFDSQVTPTSSTNSIPKGVQVVRADGRVVVIPPPERPTTRSRNKPKNNPSENPSNPRTPVKVLEDDVVSGAELDSSGDEDKSDDDPEKLWCICNQPHNNRFMICCDSCEEWYHGKCVNVTKQMGQMMEKEGREWICLYCKDISLKRPAAAARRVRKASRTSGTESAGAASDSNPENTATSPVAAVVPPKVQGCIVCGKPCRNHSIYCSDACIVQNAKDVEKVVVFERSTGKLLSGNEAPTVANLDKWLKKHPGFEVVRSKANVAKQPVLGVATKTQATLQIVKNPLHQGVSLALQKRGIQVGLLKHTQRPQSENKDRTPIKKLAPKTIPHKTPQTPLKQPPKIITEPKTIKKLPTQLKITQQLTPTPPTPTPSPVSKKRKSTTVESTPTPKEKPKPKPAKPKSAPAEPNVSVNEKNREESVRDNVKKSVGEQLMLRIQAQNEIKLNKDEVAKISNEIESQLFKCFGDTGQKYRNKYRSLMFNIKDNKNQTLWRSICQKTVSAYQLVRLSPDDLASQELALWRERENKHQLDMITKTELDQLGRTQQFVIKTHKGEQEVEDNRLNTGVDKTEMVTGLIAESTPTTEATVTDKKTKEKEKKRSRSDRDKKHDKSSSKDKNTLKDHKTRSSSRNKRSSSRSKRSVSRDRNQRRKSRSRSRGSLRRTEKQRSRSRSRDRYKRSSHKTTRHKKSPPHSTTDKLDKKSKEILENLVDNKIVPPLEDKLWKHVTQEDMTTAPLAESDSDHEPTSTVTISTPPREDLSTAVSTPSSINPKDDAVSAAFDDEGGLSPPPKTQDYVWSGTINMIDVAEITITAHDVSGDCSGLGDELPSCLDVVGRIPPETVWDYISKMKSSNTKSIALLRLNSTSVEAQMPYIALYSYLQSRNRLGVVKSYNKAVKDFYILPLASHMPIPQALLPLSGPSFEEQRPVLLLGIIVRDNRKRSLFVNPVPSTNKRLKLDKTLTPPVRTSARSYTPPPTSTTKSSVSAPPSTSKDLNDEDMDEPYSPKDSDPETAPVTTEVEPKQSKSDSSLDPKFIEPFSNKFDAIPGLNGNPVTLEKQQLQREMEVLDLQIAKQKEELQHMSQNIVSSSSTNVGDALSTIELPRNIQQILDSIKTPQITSSADSTTTPTPASSDLTIPLMLPKISSRNNSSSSLLSSSGLPLNISRFKSKSASKNSPSVTETQLDSYSKRTVDSSGVLSSLSDDELIRKANEMMKTADESDTLLPAASQSVQRIPAVPPVYPVQPPPPPPTPKSTISRILESNQPPIPGLD